MDENPYTAPQGSNPHPPDPIPDYGPFSQEPRVRRIVFVVLLILGLTGLVTLLLLPM